MKRVVTDLKNLPRDVLRPKEPTKLQMFVAEIQKTGSSEYRGAVHSVTVRIPSFDFCTIEALSRAGGMPRNKVIVNLLESAIQEMWGELSPEMHETVSLLQGTILQDLAADGTAEKGEL